MRADVAERIAKTTADSLVEAGRRLTPSTVHPCNVRRLALKSQSATTKELVTLDEAIDFALAEIYMDGANPVRVREQLKQALKPFLRRGQ